MSKLWELKINSIAYVRANTEEEARKKYNEQPCAFSADFIDEIRELPEDEEPFFDLEDQDSGGTET